MFIDRKAAIQSISSKMGDTAQTRNKRMFGNLNQARTILTKDHSLFERQVISILVVDL